MNMVERRPSRPLHHILLPTQAAAKNLLPQDLQNHHLQLLGVAPTLAL